MALQNKLTLERRFGLTTAVFIVIASMIGSGVLTSSGYMLQRSPHLPLMIALWIVGGVIALCGALSMGEMATAYPEVGGDYVYVREAFGPRAAFAYGCSMVPLGFAAPVALVAYTLASFALPYAKTFDAGLFSFITSNDHMFCSFFAAIMILLFTLMHVRSYHESALTQCITTVFKVVVLAAFVALGLLSPQGDWTHFTQKTPDMSLPQIGANLILVMYCYTGWNGAVYIAGEIKNPQKNLAASLILGTMFVTIIYISLNLLYGYAIDPLSIGSMSENDIVMIAETANRALFSPGLSSAFSIMIGLGVIASLSSFIMTGPRIVYAMSQDGHLPGMLGRSCERTQLPKHAIWFQTILSLLLLLSGSYGFLLDLAGYGLGVISLLVVLPIFWLRKKPHYKASFQVPLYPFIPAVFLLTNIAMLLAGAAETTGAAALSLACVGLPYLVYPWINKWRS